jgi:hypothetical protein
MLLASWVCAEDIPVQFRVWGTRGPELAPLPAGCPATRHLTWSYIPMSARRKR